MRHARRILGGLALIAGGALSSCATPPPPRAIEQPARQFRVQQMKLPSGMQLLVEESDSDRLVASVLLFGAGAADDPPGKEGLAHLVEHLSFRAHGPGQPAVQQRLVDEGIGEWNGTTSADVTYYEQLTLPDRVSAMARVESGRLRNPLEGVDEATFALERQVVVNELLWRHGNPEVPEATNALLRQLYPQGDAYAHGIIGTVDSLSRLTLEDARAFARSHYRPERVTWVLAGKVDRLALVRTLREELPPELTEAAGPSPEPQPLLPPPDPPPRRDLPTLRGPWKDRTLVIAWTLPAAHGPLQSVVSALPQIVASQVPVEEVESRSASLRPLDRSSVLAVFLTLRPGARADAVFERFLEALPGSWRDVWYEPGTRSYAVFSALRIELLERQVRATESLLARTELRASEVHRTLSAQTLAALADSTLSMHYPELVRLGRKYVTPERARAVLLEPLGPDAARDAESERQTEPDHLAVPAPAVDHTREEIAALARGPGLTVRSFKASNGLEVLVAPLGRRDVVSAVLAVPEGTATTPRPGTAELVRLAVLRMPIGRGIVVDRRWGEDTGLVRLEGPPSQLAALLDKLAEEVNVRISNLAEPASLKFSGEPPLSRFDRRFWRALYGDTRWGSRATEAQVRAASVGEVNDWLYRAFDPTRAVLVLSGDVEGDVQAEVERRLAGWHARGSETAARSPVTPAPWGRLRLFTDASADRSQVRLRFGCLLSGNTLADELAAELLAAELKRRWTELLRGARGVTYGVLASVSNHRDGSRHLSVETDVQGSGVPEAAAEIARTWRELPAPWSDPVTLRRVQWDFARRYAVRYVTGLSVAVPLAQERLRGHPITVLDDVPATLLSLTPERMSSVAQACQGTSLLGLHGAQPIIESRTLLPEAERVSPDR